MFKLIGKPSLRAALILVLIASMTSIATPVAFGQEGSRKEEAGSPEQKTLSTPEAPRQVEITSTVFRDALAVATKPAAPAVPLPAPAASTAPLTAGEKFDRYFRGQFLSPGSYARSLFTGMFNELLDNNEGKKDTVDDYFADSLTRMARSFGNRAANGFFEKFAYPVIFRQDPRYHRSDKRGAGAKIGHAVSRLFITQGDNCGCDQFNISYLAGGLTGAAVSNYWQRDDRRGVGRVFRRWGTHMAFTAVGNIMREFLGGQ